jgi:hypothetical protein
MRYQEVLQRLERYQGLSQGIKRYQGVLRGIERYQVYQGKSRVSGTRVPKCQIFCVGRFTLLVLGAKC